MRLLLLFTCFAALSACHRTIQTQPINLSYLFDDNSSKVWLIDKLMIEDRNYSPLRNAYKDICIFYSNGKCVVQPLNTLGDRPGAKGKFSVDSRKRTIRMKFKNETWNFDLAKTRDDYIVLKPRKDSDMQYTVHLIPLPEL